MKISQEKILMTTKIVKRIRKVLCGTIFAFGLMMISSMNVKAENSYEVEPNNSIEQAQTVRRNTVTLAKYASTMYVAGKVSGQHIMNGKLEANDVDYYKFYLDPDDDNILDFKCFTSQRYILDICTADGQPIEGNRFTCAKEGKNIFRVNISTEGAYYLRITHGSSSTVSKDYLFTIGNANCDSGTYAVSYDPQILGGTNPTFEVKEERFKKDNSLPNYAIVYQAILEGTPSRATSSREIRNERNTSWKTAQNYTWKCDLVVNDTNALKQTWQIQYNAGSSTKSIVPTLRMYYVYPLYPIEELYN